MSKLRLYICMFLSLLAFCGCINEEQYADDPPGNLEALWRIIDEHYCFFDYKGIDWNEVHARYAKQMNNEMSEHQQFEVLTNMLSELKDGHVNLYTSFDLGRYWKWHEDFPSNFSEDLIDKYLKTDYRIASGMKYRILDDNVGYIRCSSFANSIGTGNLDDILLYLAPCNGLIIDIRDNPGGQLTGAETLASRFTNRSLLVGYMQHKTGKGHRDFSDMKEQWLDPGNGLRWQKRAVVLTNRSVYSAANEFVKYMQQCPLVTIVGDNTGGGAGLPFSSELPNGWSVRFSACPMYDKNKQSTEFGIAPDYSVALTATDAASGIDTLIEYARAFLAKEK
ncbi:MAG TPA: S41 family peptidase [Prevotella sp.]